VARTIRAGTAQVPREWKKSLCSLRGRESRGVLAPLSELHPEMGWPGREPEGQKKTD